MSEELEVLREVLSRLDSADVPYMVTGSMAANFYTVPRMTRDIDIVVELKLDKAEKVCALFEPDFYVDLDMIKQAIRTEQMFNLIHNQSVVKIDFIIRKSHLYRETEFQRRRKIDLGGFPIWVVSIEDLILSKLFWAKDSQSEMQLKDVRNLLESGSVDKDYLQKWMKDLGLDSIYEKV